MEIRLSWVLVLGALASCSGLGGVPKSLVDLYDQAKPDGVIEIEIGRDGSIREMEAEIPADDLPPAVRAAMLAQAPQAKVTGAERELQQDGNFWEVKVQKEGRAWEFVFNDRGELIESEQEIDKDQAPAGVLAAADRTVAGGTFKSIERVQRGSETEYHVKKEQDGVSYKVVLAPDGTVKRAVREHRAEIEIPLAR